MTINNSFSPSPLLPRNARQFFIAGPVGRLDCLELIPKGSPRGIALIFHPDPKAGGTYTNKIVQSIAKVMNNKGYTVFCPNLRGVGMSEGIHDFGRGEIEDGMAVYQYASAQLAELPVVIAGFSFGCTVASNLAIQVAFLQLVLIGPAVSRYPVVVPDVNRILVVHGHDDEVIPLEEVFGWAKLQDIPLSVFPKTGHFFHGKLIQLQNYLTQMLNI